ncbi:MAG: hypothetical protein HC890_09675 [Chloroflexaceae bacterium]|nr:hypothetical protein [Chloroflexaceae bacterium]
MNRKLWSLPTLGTSVALVGAMALMTATATAETVTRTGPNGGSSTVSRQAADGQITSEGNRTGPNGGSAAFTREREIGSASSSSTRTGPNGQNATVNRSAIPGQRTYSRTGPNGGTFTRVRNR